MIDFPSEIKLNRNGIEVIYVPEPKPDSGALKIGLLRKPVSAEPEKRDYTHSGMGRVGGLGLTYPYDAVLNIKERALKDGALFERATIKEKLRLEFERRKKLHHAGGIGHSAHSFGATMEIEHFEEYLNKILEEGK